MRNMIIVVVVVVIIAIVLIAGLYAAGVGPFSTSGSGGSGGVAGESYSTAVTQAKPAASSTSGGPWTVVAGIGVNAPNTLKVNATSLNSVSGSCTEKVLAGASGITSLPGSSSAVSTGTTPIWIIEFTNSSGAILEVAVLGGTATAVLEESAYGSCLGGSVATVSQPSTVVDSPAAASAALAAGGTAYLNQHSGVFAEYVLIPTEIDTILGTSTLVTSASWVIVLTNCNPSLTSTTTTDGKTSAQFIAYINATTGVVSHTLTTSSGCAGSTGGTGGGGTNVLLTHCPAIIADLIQMGTGPYSLNGSMDCTGFSPVAGDFTVKLENATTLSSVSTGSITDFEIVNYTLSGNFTLDSTYNFGSNTWTNPSAEIGNLSGPNEFHLDSTSSLGGDVVLLTSTSSCPFAGSIVLKILVE
jgi:hypothetical protein